VYEIELKAAYTHISNSKTDHRIEDERLYKALQKDVTEAQVQRTERQETKWGRFKASKFMVPYTVCVTDNLFN